MRLAMAAMLLTSLSFLGNSGCEIDEGYLDEGFESELIRAAGCGDMEVYSYNSDSSVALFFELYEGLAEEANTSGETITATYDLTDDAIAFSVQSGESLTAETCTDVYQEPSPVHVKMSYTATAGSVTLIVEPGDVSEPWETAAYATVTLENVMMISEDGADELELPFFQMQHVYVGWFPG